jgi:ribosomal protein L40E
MKYNCRQCGQDQNSLNAGKCHYCNTKTLIYKYEEEIGMKSPIELMKEELCSRYGIEPEQIQINVNVWDLETKEAVDKITNDYFIAGVSHDFIKPHVLDDGRYVSSVTHRSNAKYKYMEISAFTKKGLITNES